MALSGTELDWIVLKKDEHHAERHEEPTEEIGWTNSKYNAQKILRWLNKLENEAQHYYDLLKKNGIDPEEKQGAQEPGEKPKKRRRMIQT